MMPAQRVCVVWIEAVGAEEPEAFEGPVHFVPAIVAGDGDMRPKHGIVVPHQTIWRWGRKIGVASARQLRRKKASRKDIWHLDEGVPRGTRSNVGAELHGR